MKAKLNAIYDTDLQELLRNLNLEEKLLAGSLKCKFTGEVMTMTNIHSIFPEEGGIKFVSNNPEAIKLLSEYINEKNL